MAVLIILAVFLRIKLRKMEDIPKGVQNAVEAVIEFFQGFIHKTGGDKLMGLGSWFFTIFAFILSCSLIGMLGIRPPTADWATTFALALATFILTLGMGIRCRKGKYLKSFIEPNPIFLPLNIINEIANPISMSFRLFGNVLGGMILLTLTYSMAPIFLRIIIPIPLHIYFDVIMGALQTYIFCILSLTFIKGAAEG
jgi:F-type H+-transporting ATPase subunit a